jgi:hypothetical protein
MHCSTAAEKFVIDAPTSCEIVAVVAARRVVHGVGCMAGTWLLSFSAAATQHATTHKLCEACQAAGHVMLVVLKQASRIRNGISVVTSQEPRGAST